MIKRSDLDTWCVQIIGFSLESAIKSINYSNLRYRITSIDGKPGVTTRDYRTDRINLTIVNGFVKSAFVG
mgnify:CR=1 FL=1